MIMKHEKIGPQHLERKAILYKPMNFSNMLSKYATKLVRQQSE